MALFKLQISKATEWQKMEVLLERDKESSQIRVSFNIHDELDLWQDGLQFFMSN